MFEKMKGTIVYPFEASDIGFFVVPKTYLDNLICKSTGWSVAIVCCDL